MNDLISIVTLTHNKLAVTQRCLPSFLHAAYRPFELVVVDNGSDDGTPEWLETFARYANRHDVAVTRVRNRGNIGCSTARNQGVEAARGDQVLFVDNDVALRSTDTLTVLSERLRSDAKLAIAGPKIVYPYPPFDIQCAGVGISRSGRVLFRGRGESRSLPQFNEEREMQCLISACFMVKRSVIDRYGGFDEEFNPVEYEDFDLCYRYRDAGHTVLYVPSVEMYHFESVTTAGTPSLPNTRLIIRHGLKFKQRWRRMFEQEDGPDDEATRWRKLPVKAFEAIGAMPLKGDRR